MKECAAGPGDRQDKILKQTGTPVTTTTKKEKLLKNFFLCLPMISGKEILLFLLGQVSQISFKTSR